MALSVDEVGSSGLLSATKALSNEGRLKVIAFLCQETPPAKDLELPDSIRKDPRWFRFEGISEITGLPQGTLSYHVSQLGEADLIERTHRGRGTYIRLRWHRIRDLAETFAQISDR